MPKYLKWIFILTVLTAQTVYAADSCQAVFRASELLIDNRFGHVGQNDPYFDVVGLSGPTQSTNLCGPTSIANGLVKLRRTFGLASSRNTQQSVEHLVRKYFDANLLVAGTDSRKMKRAIKNALAEDHLAGAVHVYSNKETGADYEGQIRPSAVRSAIDDDTFVIAGIGRYNAKTAVATDDTNRTSAHYVLIVGYNAREASKFYAFDPLYPGRIREIELKLVANPHRQFDSIDWRFTDGLEKSSTVLLEDLIVTKARLP